MKIQVVLRQEGSSGPALHQHFNVEKRCPKKFEVSWPVHASCHRSDGPL